MSIFILFVKIILCFITYIFLLLLIGTVDTSLSRPYHKNVPASKLFSAEKSANYLLSVIDNLTHEDTGKFINWDGTEIPF